MLRFAMLVNFLLPVGIVPWKDVCRQGSLRTLFVNSNICMLVILHLSPWDPFYPFFCAWIFALRSWPMQIHLHAPAPCELVSSWVWPRKDINTKLEDVKRERLGCFFTGSWLAVAVSQDSHWACRNTNSSPKSFWLCCFWVLHHHICSHNCAHIF